MKGIVVLVGFRAVGKTTVGKKLAEKLSYAFADTDLLICEQKGASVNRIVQKEGWGAFRTCEKSVLQKVTGFSEVVVSTGGGAILHRDVWNDIKKVATVVWLTADQEVIVSRILQDNSEEVERPALTTMSVTEEVSKILGERLPLYEKAADFSVDTGKIDAESASDMIAAKIRQQ